MNHGYSFSFTAGALLVTESLSIVQCFLRQEDWDAVRDEVIRENLLRKRTKAASIRFNREIERRLKTLTPDQLAYLGDATAQEQRQLLFVAACKVYTFIYDFVTEVIRPKILLFDNQLRNSDYEKFLLAKELDHPEIGSLTEKSRNKVRQVLYRILAEAGLLDSTEDMHLTPVVPSGRVCELVMRDDPRWLTALLLIDADIARLTQEYGKQPAQSV